MPPRRERFVIGPGPLDGGSKSGQVICTHIPEKSGMADFASCARPGSATNAAVKSKPHRVKFIVRSMLSPDETGRDRIETMKSRSLPQRPGRNASTRKATFVFE